MGKFTEFKLPLKSLAPGNHVFEYTLSKVFFDNMENTDVHGADVKVTLNVNYNGDVYALRFDIHGEVTLLCDRCLDQLPWPIDAEYVINVRYGDEYNDETDDLLVIPQSDNDLNVAYMIYDTVVLAIPIKHVHPMGKCNRQMSAMLHKHRAVIKGEEDLMAQEMLEGIDDEPEETERPTDPRWDALKDFNND